MLVPQQIFKEQFMFYTCPECNGSRGTSSFDEVGRPEHHPCYHCQATGVINDIGMEDDRREVLLATLAQTMTRRAEAFCREHGEEDWGFHAAEAMIDLRTYRDHQYWVNRLKITEVLKTLDADFVGCLLDLLAPKPEPIVVKSVTVEPCVSDDVPF